MVRLLKFKVEEISLDELNDILMLNEEQECEECDFCEKSIGLCPLYRGGNNKITWMEINNLDSILENKRISR